MGDGFGRVTHHHEYYLNDGSVSFLTGNTLFRVHKSFFERESEFFRSHFADMAEDDPHGGTDALPITLNVTADEFAQLLWVWYDRAYSYRQQSKDNWIVILRLATDWSFPKIKDLALRELETYGLSPAERISIYNTHGIEDDDRLLDSYVELCKSPVVPSAADGQLLQMETLINILQAREDAQRRAAELDYESPTSASLGDETLREIVSRFFKKGLDPRSYGNSRSTGSGFQASHLNLNGEPTQRDGASATITLGTPQVPERKAPSTDGPSHPADSSQQACDMGNQTKNDTALTEVGEDKTKATNLTQDKGSREKAKEEQMAKEKAEKERQEQERMEKEKQAKEKQEMEKIEKEKQEQEAREKAEKEKERREKEKQAKEKEEREARERAKAEELKRSQTQTRKTRGK